MCARPSSIAFIALAILFGIGVWVVAGPTYGKEFYAGWLTEYSLSVDNLFIFLLIMEKFRVPARLQQYALLVGIILALVFRGVFIGLGAAIHGWAPADFFVKYAGAGNPFAVLIAVGIGIPLYSNAAGVMPLVQVLHDKGLPMGTLLAFMMAVVALSLPEMILLRRVLKPPLIATFITVVGLGIVAVGYLFNAVIPS